MGGLLVLARPINCVLSAAGVLVGASVALGSLVSLLSPKGFANGLAGIFLAAVASALFTAGGNALNDIYDRQTDTINHPERPIPSGRITVARARAFAGLAFGLAVLLGVFLNPWCLAILLSNALLMYAYESGLKAKGFAGNIAIAYLAGSLFLFAGFSVYTGPQDQAPLVRVGALAALAFLATLGREVTKDIEDMRGDLDRRTLPQRIGARRAGYVAAAFFVAGVAMSAVPWWLELLGLWYGVVVLVADGMFIYAAFHSATRSARSQRVAKYAMIVALAAFVAGGVT